MAATVPERRSAMAALSLANYWHPIATVEEVSERPARFTLLGEQLVAFRHDTGVAVFKDLCVHRGTALSGGRVQDGRLICPYHGWTYDRSGACVHIPSLPPGAPIPAQARAIAYSVREAYGLVWVAMQEPAQAFPKWPEEAWSRTDYRVLFVNQYRWKTSAGRYLENVMDFSHFNIVHAGYTELADGPVIQPYEVATDAGGMKFAYVDGRLRRNYTLDFPFILHDAKHVIRTDRGGTWSEAGNMRAGDVTILTFIASPVDAAATNIYAYVTRNHHLASDDSEYTAGFDAVMEQDRVVVESQRPAQLPLDAKEELHLRISDAASIVYRRMLQRLERGELLTP
jgi:phenylpropionate dioxygenase-like ring-hydroxylating dioxygenase large terminal subunit